MRTIRKLGFQVSAVWNGKEALDYLLASQEPNPKHKKPDIILMDVQMPVIDGYRATHLIRHHQPYAQTSGNIPIVAMTASAIQGDREKCKKAGMDDYLAKPVKGKTLEKMLIRWVTQKRTPTTPGTEDESNCSEPGAHDYVEKQNRPLLKRQSSHHMPLPIAENEGDRVVRRSLAEEKATSLRNDKLIDAAGGKDEGLVPHVQEKEEPGQQLTVENVGKLEREAEGGSRNGDSDDNGSVSSVEVAGMGSERQSRKFSVSKDGYESPSRPKIGRRWRDSERTVTGPK